MLRKRILHAAALGGFLLAGPAGAVPLFVDFTSTDWSAAEGSTSASRDYGTLSVTLTASGGALTFNAYEAPESTSYTGSLALGGDGIGIGDDEISWGQSLGVSFSSAVTVLSFALLDLFPDEGPDGTPEQAAADFGAGGIVTGSAQGVDPSGYYGSGNLNLGGIQLISFAPIGGRWSDFALAGLWIDDGTEILSLASVVAPARVSEPGSLLLLGLSLLAFGAWRRRLGRGLR